MMEVVFAGPWSNRMAIWFDSPCLDTLNSMGRNTIHDALEIRFTDIGDDYLQATMPVDQQERVVCLAFHLQRRMDTRVDFDVFG